MTQNEEYERRCGARKHREVQKCRIVSLEGDGTNVMAEDSFISAAHVYPQEILLRCWRAAT